MTLIIEVKRDKPESNQKKCKDTMKQTVKPL